MRIWVDADACPGAIKDILFRAAERVKVELILVANRPVRTPPSPYLRSIRVPAGFDVADRRIAELMQPGDLVVTADVPLAAAVVSQGGLALDPRGELYTEENIGDRLATRDLMDELRAGGMVTGGPRAFGKGDRQAFANQLDRLLARRGDP
jgi:uncharacterized protein YaiI (UPF0178 family)